ncbi:DNA glycosylase [Malaciobacter molluscorum]|uniref:uracil-DNA glycosylase family protein n=1 Tax=Malaciobacter molluscorum TaxID=1032072 RepID=UPI00100B410B|nr:uracil-DNA glycosylase family protein [Malaciobacter molluscorum]RXJ95130.1 DNA glycosylase [Malaciobacter molluscorum]
MFYHFHPYKPFIFEDTNTLIIGTLPPPRFCEKDFKDGDVDFCYGSKNNQLWPAIDKIFNLNLLYDNSNKSINQRKSFLKKNYIGICDIVESCHREKFDASDLGMQNVKLRNIIEILENYKNINKIIFTGKNSKNSPEYFFRKQISNTYTMKLKENEFIREHTINISNRKITIFSLTSPSNAANRSIGSSNLYKLRKKQNPNYSTFLFRVDEYKFAFF